jgi:hypothetical protein
LDISKLQFLIKKRKTNFQLYFFSSVFGRQNPGSGLDQDPDSLEILNPDAQPESVWGGHPLWVGSQFGQ